MGMHEHPGADELIILVERMGYGIEIDEIRRFVEINPGSSRNRKRRRFAGIATALEFMREQERKRTSLARPFDVAGLRR